MLQQTKRAQRDTLLICMSTVQLQNILSSYLFFACLVLPQILPFDFGEEPINSGDSTTMMCSISKGDLPVSITWMHNNSTVQTTDGLFITSSKKFSTLTIDAVRDVNMGEYTCVAKNRAGTTTYSSYLHVNGRYLHQLLFLYFKFFRKFFPLISVMNRLTPEIRCR